ncbi:MAG: hypothetical protein ABFD91_13485 [Anaerohalosphaeraceae bacterium]
MFKRITIVAILVALALPVLAAPEQERGTWGKEKAPAAPAEPQREQTPAMQLNRWLNEFNAAYENRDGEKMERLLDRLDAVKSKMPEMPRFDNWVGEVKEAYKAEDVEKMGSLLERANHFRQALNTQLQQGRRMRQGQGQREGFAPDQGEQQRPVEQFRQMRQLRQQRQLQNQPGSEFDNAASFAEQPQAPGRQGRAFRGQGRDTDARGPEAAPLRGNRQFRQGLRGQQQRPDTPMPMLKNREALKDQFHDQFRSPQPGQFRGQRGQGFGRGNDACPFCQAPRQQRQRDGIEGNRPNVERPDAQRPNAEMNLGGRQNQFGQQQPMQPNFGPRNFAPRGQMGYGRMMPQGRFNRPDMDAAPMAPRGYGRPNMGQNRMMRPDFAPNFNNQGRGFGGRMNQPERSEMDDFWQD